MPEIAASVRRLLPPDLPPDLRSAWDEADDDARRAEALTRIARHVRQGSMPLSHQIAQLGLEYALRAAAPETTARLMLGLAMTSAHLNRARQASEYLHHVFVLLEEHGLETVRLHAMNMQGIVMMLTGNESGAWRVLLAAATLAEQRSAWEDLAHLHVNLACLAGILEQPQESLHHLDLLHELLERHLPPEIGAGLWPYEYENRAAAHVMLARQAHRKGRAAALEEALAEGEQALSHAQQALAHNPNLTVEMLCETHATNLCLLAGQPDLAEAHAQRAIDLHHQSGQNVHLEAHLSMGDVLATRRAWPEALEQYQQAAQIARKGGRQRELLNVLHTISQLHAQAGNVQAALEASRGALVAARATVQQLSDPADWAALPLAGAETPTGEAGVFSSTSWQVRLRQAEAQARQDPLTGLLNRRGLDEGLQNLAMNTPDEPLLLAFIDVDHFKRVNDGHSHAVGDRALREMGQLLRRSVPRDALLARYGGEEFVLVLPTARVASEQGGAYALLEGLRWRVQAHDWNTHLGTWPLTVSVGYALAPAREAEQALALADEHLYSAKQGGRNRVYPAPEQPPLAAVTPDSESPRCGAARPR